MLVREDDTHAIIGAAMEVHGAMGKGFLENVYQEALEIELRMRKIPFEVKPKLVISYKGHRLQQFYIPDLIIFGDIPVELKAHSEPLSKADLRQLLNSLRTCGGQVGLVFNFGRASLDFERIVA